MSRSSKESYTIKFLVYGSLFLLLFLYILLVAFDPEPKMGNMYMGRSCTELELPCNECVCTPEEAEKAVAEALANSSNN